MPKSRSPEELRNALNDQLEALAASCAGYDDGKKWEALRIAVAVNTIVHDGGRNSVSILRQIGLKEGLRFVASGKFIDCKNVLADTPLVAIRIHGGDEPWAEHIPRFKAFAENSRALSFSDWWERDLIFRDASFQLSRKNLVFNLRSVEGGAHYDAMVKDPNYLRFAQEQASKPIVQFNSTSGESMSAVVLGAELATMRQIGWELMKTLELWSVTKT
jgi:hypothetical protein